MRRSLHVNGGLVDTYTISIRLFTNFDLLKKMRGFLWDSSDGKSFSCNHVDSLEVDNRSKELEGTSLRNLNFVRQEKAQSGGNNGGNFMRK